MLLFVYTHPTTLFLVIRTYEGDILVLNNIQRTDMGPYLCIASNGIPPSVSKRFVVKVHCKYNYHNNRNGKITYLLFCFSSSFNKSF